jgi:hypothetical protein
VGFGQYSVKVDERYREVLPRPFLLDHWPLALLAAPLFAAWVTALAFSRRELWRYAHTLPAFYMAKLGWTWGAVQRLRGKVEWYAPGSAS